MSGLSGEPAENIVNRLDPDGRIRDIIDAAYARYHQGRSTTDGAPPPMNERPKRHGTPPRDP